MTSKLTASLFVAYANAAPTPKITMNIKSPNGDLFCFILNTSVALLLHKSRFWAAKEFPLNPSKNSLSLEFLVLRYRCTANLPRVLGFSHTLCEEFWLLSAIAKDWVGCLSSLMPRRCRTARSSAFRGAPTALPRPSCTQRQ